MNSAAFVRGHLEQVILPWWIDNGCDDEWGGVFSCFSNSGQRVSMEKYTWSQGRWAWLCAEISRDAAQGLISVAPQEWARRAVTTAQFIHAHALLPGSVAAFRTTREGTPLPSDEAGGLSTSVFADLFAALGLAGAAGLPTAPPAERVAWLSAAHDIVHSARCRIRSRRARTEPYPVRAGFTDSAGTMLLLHVGAELHRVSGSAASRETTQEALTEFLRGNGSEPMWRPDGWWEYRPDSSSEVDTLLARHRTPGHLLEAIWMAEQAAQIVPSLKSQLPTWLPNLAVRALELGWDDRDGGLFRYVDSDGGQPLGRRFGNDRYERLVVETWDTKLWWVHSEALYTTALLSDQYGHGALTNWYERLSAYTFSTFPDPLGHEWIQIRDRQGAPLDRVVALPVKDPFHIARSLLLLNRLRPKVDAK